VKGSGYGPEPVVMQECRKRQEEDDDHLVRRLRECGLRLEAIGQ